MATEMMSEMGSEDVEAPNLGHSSEIEPAETINPFRFINENTECQESTDIVLKVKEEVDSDPDLEGDTTSFCFGLSEEIKLNQSGQIVHYEYDNNEYTGVNSPSDAGIQEQEMEEPTPSSGGDKSDNSSMRGECGSDNSGEDDVEQKEESEALEEICYSRRASAIAARKKLKKITSRVENNPKIKVKKYKRKKDSSDEWSEGKERHHQKLRQVMPDQQSTESSLSAVSVDQPEQQSKPGKAKVDSQGKSTSIKSKWACRHRIEAKVQVEYHKWQKKGVTMTVKQLQSQALSIANEMGIGRDKFPANAKWAKRFKTKLGREKLAEISGDSSDEAEGPSQLIVSRYGVERRSANSKFVPLIGGRRNKGLLVDHNYVLPEHGTTYLYQADQKEKKRAPVRKGDSGQDGNIDFLEAYLKSRGFTEKIHSLSPPKLNLWLCEFFRNLKKYPPWQNTEKDIFASLVNYLQIKKYPYNIKTYPMFSACRDAVMRSKPLDEKAAMMPLVLRTDTSAGLLWCMWWHNYQCFGITSMADHLALKWGDIQLCINTSSQEVLEYTQVTGRKPFLKRVKKTIRSTSHDPQSPYNPVTVYKRYTNRRPPGMMGKKTPFYLAVDKMNPRGCFKPVPVSAQFLHDLCIKLSDRTLEAVMDVNNERETTEKQSANLTETPVKKKVSDLVSPSVVQQMLAKPTLPVSPQVAPVRPVFLIEAPSVGHRARLVDSAVTNSRLVSLLRPNPGPRPIAAVNPQTPEPLVAPPTDDDFGERNNIGLCISEVRGDCHEFDHQETNKSEQPPEGALYQGGLIEIKPIDEPEDIDVVGNFPSYPHQSFGDPDNLEAPTVAGIWTDETKGYSEQAVVISSDESDSSEVIEMLSEPPAKRHTCPTCRKTLPDAQALRQHMRIIHFGGAVKCEICKVRMPTYDLKSHNCPGSGISSWKCTICQVMFARRQRWDVHMRTVHSNRLSKCHLCSKAFAGQDMLQKHLMLRHRSRKLKANFVNTSWTPQVGSANTRSAKKIVRCPLCRKCFINQGTLRAHQVRVHEKVLKEKADPIVFAQFGSTTVINIPYVDGKGAGKVADESESQDCARSKSPSDSAVWQDPATQPNSPVNSDPPSDTFGNIVPRSRLSSSGDDLEPKDNSDDDLAIPSTSSLSKGWSSGRIVGRSVSGSSDDDDNAGDVFPGPSHLSPSVNLVSQSPVMLFSDDDDSDRGRSPPLFSTDTAGMLVPRLRTSSSEEDLPSVPIATPFDPAVQTQNVSYCHQELFDASQVSGQMSEQTFSCQTCGQVFKKERNLIVHKNNVQH